MEGPQEDPPASTQWPSAEVLGRGIWVGSEGAGQDSLGDRWYLVDLGLVCASPSGLGGREKDLS